MRIFVGLWLLFLIHTCAAQGIKPAKKDSSTFEDQIETIEMVSKLDPNKAALFSAVLPGLGQVYNGDGWKLPIIYSGGLIIGHFIYNNHQLYNTFNNAMIADLDASSETNNPFPRFTSANLQRNRDFVRRNRDFLIIIGIAYYMLNIVEAHIAAHLKEFTVNDDLSYQIKPSFEALPSGSPTFGIGVSLYISR